MSEHDAPPPGSYANHRHIVDDPSRREAFLVQVKGTVEGLRGAYRWHAIAAVVGILALFLVKPSGWIATQRMLLVGLALTIDIVALAGLRTVAAQPARYVIPLAVVDVLVIGVILAQAIANDAFNFAWLLLLILPVMLLIYLRDARAIAPILAEHAVWRRAQATPPDGGDEA